METKNQKRRNRKYDVDFKQEVLKMIASGRSVTELSRSLGISKNLIYNWQSHQKKRNKKEGKEDFNLASETEATLNKRIRELEQERDILKKALGIFSRVI